MLSTPMDWKDRVIAYDCRYFLGDRPCIWHKKVGAQCLCEEYDPISERILLIKLDAMGDVLRTTCLLPGLAKAHPNAAIIWVTRSESVSLLENNPYISDVITYGTDTLARIGVQDFDRVINLDTGRTSLILATLAKGVRKSGFVLDGQGHIRCTNAAAEMWLKMGLFDDLKKKNTRTYQEIMHEILEISSSGMRYVLNLTDEEKSWAETHLLDLGISPNEPLIGLNTGGGGRWEFKQWREDRFAELIDKLHMDHGNEIQILLLGGVAERELNQRIAGRVSGPVFDGGSDNEVRYFASMISFCDVVVSGDTLAMHIALALGCRVVALFGPTSASEIDIFDLGKKIAPNMKCLSCYKTVCDFVPNCMQLITSDTVKDAVLTELARSRRSV